MIKDLMEAQRDSLKIAQAKAQKRALRLTLEKLRQVKREMEALPLGTWGQTERFAVTRRLQAAVSQLSRGQVDLLQLGLADTARVSAKETAAWLSALDQRYMGVNRQLRFDTLTWIDTQAEQLSKVRLQTYAKSFNRYGATTVRAIEDEIAKTILVGEPWTKVKPRVVAITADVVGDRQWMVDRILKTETSTAYNSMQLNALLEEDNDEDPMLKRLVATFDNRTGRDSVALHGQTRKVQEPFYDAYFGVSYQSPPNRPNDREIVVGWRASYGPEFEGGDKGYIVDTATPERGAPITIKGANAARAEGPMEISAAMNQANMRGYRKQLRAAQARAANVSDPILAELAGAEVQNTLSRLDALADERDKIVEFQALLTAKKAQTQSARAEKAAAKAKAAQEAKAMALREASAGANALALTLAAEAAQRNATKAATLAREAAEQAQDARDLRSVKNYDAYIANRREVRDAFESRSVEFRPAGVPRSRLKAHTESSPKRSKVSADLRPGDVVVSRTGAPLLVRGFVLGGMLAVETAAGKLRRVSVEQLQGKGDRVVVVSPRGGDPVFAPRDRTP